MPPPHAFWVIVDGATPTAFRAKERDTLIPTLKQLQRTQPNVALRWFDRGRLWDSPLAARDALRAKRLARPDRRPDWRPGGNHVDPRERFKLTRDQKRVRFKKRQSWKKAGKPASQGAGKQAPAAGARTARPRAPERPRAGGGSPRAFEKGDSKTASHGGWKAASRRRDRRPGRGGHGGDG